jgi:hypothetical protein
MKFEGNGGVAKDQITSVQESIGRTLPGDFIDFLRKHNGGEGFVGDEYLILWKLEELREFNRDYEVHDYLPDVILFGSNGSGEAYGFRTSQVPWDVIKVPFVGMAQDLCERVAGSFSEVLITLEQS